ncbi:MAG: glycoside hydrolase family 3 protein [Actinomycetales bacterium]
MGIEAVARGTLLPGFTGTRLPSWLDERLRHGLAGVCLFGSNIVDADQVKDLTTGIFSAHPEALVAIDEEGGDVTRLHYATGSPYPGNAVLGRIDDVACTETVARRVGWELRRAGCNLDFAPDIDTNSNPDNPVIGVRSFGADPDLVARHGVAWVRGLQTTGVAATVKHFPGHGDTGQDSHVALPVIDVSLELLHQRELAPFRAAVDAGVKAVMTSHIVVTALDPDRPATLSPQVISTLLRKELGFEGVVVSDALDMAGASGRVGIPAAAVQALAAGCDLLCIGTDTTEQDLCDIEREIAQAVARGDLSAERVAEAAARVQRLGAELRDQRERGEPDRPADDAEELRRIVESFDLRTDIQPWCRTATSGFTVIRVETAANIAVGSAPWGPFPAAERQPQSNVTRPFTPGRVLVVREGEGAEVGPLEGPVLVVGKDLHRRPFARDLIARLRQANPSVLVVDMGWPGTARGREDLVDIATFGASRLVGEALLTLLDGAIR